MAGINQSSKPYFAIPESLDIPPDKLQCRLDIYNEIILLHSFEKRETITRQVSAIDIARAFTKELRFHSNILPPNALWWSMGPGGEEIALWQRPKIWKVALVMEAFKPPRRFTLPMPVLIFICSPGRSPRVFAAKSRPAGMKSAIYRAPLFNLLHGESSCPGTHKYPDKVEEIPESFFTSFFTKEGSTDDRSKKYPKDLLLLWEELDGKKSYPMKDLVHFGTLDEIMKK